MSDVSIGPGPASNKKTSVQEEVDAQAETDREGGRGLAGAEAKPFANRPPTKDADPIPSASREDESPSAADGAANLICGRRNAGRE
ncbi:hypothetical protein [Novosphingobium sp. fls2-241-R2A-195]|jgi:hypothetical protein|uniref:hypothetical protein n=1 Tax=Novosphingobium sp. fls2-241-R2A-195 TaxID=3040296 RepID=UPI00254B3E36|nr:hypothetical protein [Novosphingobium sp. fls2-241-R2A-195]